MFKVQRRMCATCIYRRTSPLDISKLEKEVSDGHGGFFTHRVCHHAPDSTGVCCRGFWTRHKDKFQAGQLAQRLRMVLFVDADELDPLPARRKERNGKRNEGAQA